MSAYTQTEMDRIADGLREGLSASQIAKALSEFRGASISRNAIIGVVRRNKKLRAVGFDRAKPGSPKGGTPPAPYQLPGRLFLAAVDEIDREGEAYRLKSPAAVRPMPTRQPRFAAMRFADCLSSRCRAPLSYDLEEKPGPDMLCCGFRAVPGRPYCEYHEIRLTARNAELAAEAA